MPAVICRDGFTMSIQAGFMNYSTPRRNTGPWTLVECGFPSEMVPELRPYAETDETLLETVYGYVPVALVSEVLERHGGIDYESIAFSMLEKVQ